jgi:hypothetical protein
MRICWLLLAATLAISACTSSDTVVATTPAGETVVVTPPEPSKELIFYPTMPR